MSFRALLVWLVIVITAVGAYGADKPHTDLYGDPLPDGAVLRLGTSRLRSNARLIQFTPDGRTLITTEQGRMVKHWNPETGEAREVFTMPLPSWYPDALSPDGSVYVGGDGEGVCAWEIATGRKLYQLSGVLCNQVAFSPDGATLAIPDSSQQLSLWDARTGKKRPFTAAKYALWGLAFSPDGTRLAVSLSDMRVVCLDAATGRELWKTDAPSYQVAWSRDGGTLAVCMARSAEAKDVQSPTVLRFLNAADGKPTGQEPVAPPGGAAIPQYSSDGAYLAYLTTDAIGVWDVKKAKVLCNLPLTSGANNGGVPFAFAPDGKTLAAVVGCTLHRWDLATGKDLYPDVTRRGPNGLVKAVALSPDGKRIATMSWGLDPSPCIWDASTGKLLRTLPIPEKAQWFAFFLAFSPDGKRLFSATTHGKVRCWEVETGKEVWNGDPLNAKQGGRQSLAQLCLSVDGSRLFLLCLLQGSCPGPAELSVWDAATGECKLTCPVPSGCSTDVLSPAGLRFVSGGATFDMQTGDLRYQLRANNEIRANNGNEFGAVSADGALVAAPLSSWEPRAKTPTQKCRGVQVWETATGAQVALIPETEFGVLAFSPDCRTVAVVCPDDIRLWDLITCNEVERIPVTHRLLGYNPPVVFSPDGKRLVVGCADTTAVVWELSSAHRRPPAEPLAAKDREAQWNDLAGDDATKAYAAIDRLAASGDATTLVRERLRPAVGFPQDKFKPLLAALDADDFMVRDHAERQLAESAEVLESPLRAALNGALTAEQKFRIMGILKAAARLSPERLRVIRAVRALAWAGTPAAKEVLEKLAGGAADASLTREARHALSLWK